MNALTEIAILNGNEEGWLKFKVNNLHFFEKQNILNLGKMKGNFYRNSIHAFLGGFVAELLSCKLSDKYGRKRIYLLSCIVGTFGYILYILSPSYRFFFIFTAMIGYSIIFNIICIYIPEIYPTKIRNIAFSYSIFISKSSPILVPILNELMSNLTDLFFIMWNNFRTNRAIFRRNIRKIFN